MRKGKLRLMGARKFLDMPKGTIYYVLWKGSREDCFKEINGFNKSPKEHFLSLDINKIHVYGNNRGSMCLHQPIDEENYEPIEVNNLEDYIFYYDVNVVGDASPNTTLYIVIEESLLPDFIEFNCGDIAYSISKDEFLLLRDVFVGFDTFKLYGIDNTKDPANEWARDTLYNDDYYKDNPLLDTDITVNIEIN